MEADLKERNAKGDPSTIGDESTKDDYLRTYLLLRAAETRAWGLTAYVTVRAGTREALDSAEQSLVDGLEDGTTVSLDRLRQRCLRERRLRAGLVKNATPINT